MQGRGKRPSTTSLRRRIERADTAPYGARLAEGSDSLPVDEDWDPPPPLPIPIPILVERETASRIFRRLKTERGW